MNGQFTSLASTIITGAVSTATLFVTSRCNARCRMCFNWEVMEKAADREELSIEEYAKIASGFGSLHALIISGGEPLLRVDLDDIVGEFHSKAGIRHVSIPTNLFTHDAPDIIASMARRFPGVFFRILLSIDGVGKDHDRIRGKEGGFEIFMKNYDVLKEECRSLANLSINTCSVLSAFNADKIIETLDFAATLEVDDVKLIYVRGDTREDEAKDVSPELYRAAIEHAEKLTTGRKRKRSLYNNIFGAVSLVAKEVIADELSLTERANLCNAGKKFLVITDTGEVYPCEMLDRKLGSLRENNYDIKKIMATSEAKETLKFIKDKLCHCTMDCNAISNVTFGLTFYPRVMKKFLNFYKIT